MEPVSAGSHHHAVQFYRDEESLFTTVAAFLSEGLGARQPAIVIATLRHRAAIEEHLCGRLINCAKARRNGDLIMLDAEEMLGQFMVGDRPDPQLFEKHVGVTVKQLLAGRAGTVARAYGEMVDVLWKEGRSDAALALEILWNRLIVRHTFALLCGYSRGNFHRQPSQLAIVRSHHTHVVGRDNVVPFARRNRP
ncbi:MAG TPA: MEDS domain-containing protein [Vicinamibacterales bacterium]|nr:MEDS domain-containing protein [Vicinamibacterales bacterium]